MASLACLVIALTQACTSRDVIGVEVETIGVQPPSATILEGDSVQLRVVARDSRGSSIEGADATWTVQPDSVATVSPTGIVRGLVPGSVDVTATFGTVSATARVSILSGPTIDPSQGSLAFRLDREAGPHAPMSVQLRNAGGGAVSGLYTEVDYDSGASNWLDLALGGTSTPTELTATPATSGMTAGRYTAVVRVLSTESPEDSVLIPATMSLASVTISQSDGSTSVDERGSSDQFSVSLDLRPETDVVLDVVSSDPGEAIVSPATLRFSPDDWASPQLVTVTGVGDDQTDGTQSTLVTVTVDAPASDLAYGPVQPRTVTVRTVDAVGLAVLTSDGTTRATEGGATDSLRVVLDLQPSQNVIVDLAVDDASDASVAPARLTFTPSNWNQPQVATFSAVDDVIADGNRERTVTVSVDPSSDPTYAGRPNLNVSASTVDNENASFTLRETGGSTRAVEGGRTDSLTVVLDVEPLAGVIIDVSVDDRRDASVAPTALAFTRSNWSVPQTIVFSAVNDPDGDGDQARSIAVSVNPVSDPAFASLPVRTISATTVDDESAGFVVSETGGSTRAVEGGAADSISIVLGSRASDDVIFDIEVDDGDDATVTPRSITFSPDGWDIPRWVVFRAVDDPAVDGTRTREIRVSVDRRSDRDFRELADRVVSATTLDNDGAGFSLDETGDTTIVTEAGSTDAIRVELETRPLTNVVLDVSSSDTGEATASPARLTFTPSNWNDAQSITVRGVDDDAADGSQVTQIRVSVNADSDPSFRGLAAQVVAVTTTDDDDVGILVTESDGTVVSEDGSQTDVVQVHLAARPTADLSLRVTTDDATEVSVSPTTLTFTPSNWAQQQPVAVRGVDDDIADDDQVSTMTIAVAPGTSGTGYESADPQTVNVVTLDDEAPGIIVVETGGRTLVDESGTRDSIAVSLTVQPFEGVRLRVSDERGSEIELNDDRFDFTPSNWNQPQYIVVTGRDDDEVDGEQTTRVTIEVDDGRSDDSFEDVEDIDVTVTTSDDDVAGFAFTGTDGTETVSEDGDDASFEIVLTARPTSGVTLIIESGDESEVEVDPVEVSFSPRNWDDPERVRLRGQDDPFADGDQITTITVSVDDAVSNDAWDDVSDRTLQVTTVDDESAGFSLSDVSGLEVSESGSRTFEVELDGRPEIPVELTVSSSDDGEVTADPASIRFTNVDWDRSRTVRLTGVADETPDGSQESTITVAVDQARSAEAFAKVASQSFKITITDDDEDDEDDDDGDDDGPSGAEAGFEIDGPDDLSIREGDEESFTVMLTRAPSPNRAVLVTIRSADSGEVRVSDTFLWFNDDNWDDDRRVELRAERDGEPDGDQTTDVTVAVSELFSDPDFHDAPDQVIRITTIDRDGPAPDDRY